MIQLQPGDVLLFRPTNPLVRLLLDWGHVAIFWQYTKRGQPLLIECVGSGVVMRSLYFYRGRRMRVMRPNHPEMGPVAAKRAERLADEPLLYGYWDIPRFALPKLLLAKLGGLLPPTWRFTLWLLARGYRRNAYYLCSELVAQAYRDAGYPVVDEGTVPLPDDLAQSPFLHLVEEFDVPRETPAAEASV